MSTLVYRRSDASGLISYHLRTEDLLCFEYLNELFLYLSFHNYLLKEFSSILLLTFPNSHVIEEDHLVETKQIDLETKEGYDSWRE